jgi:outer membrane protein assembly factor BamB
MNRIRTGQILAAAAMLVLAAFVTLRNSGVREVHRAQDPINFAVLDARPSPGDWPWYQGTMQSNAAPLENPPVHWSPADSSGWIVPMSSRDKSALCLWGEKLFLPITDAGLGSISLQCLDPASGRMIWQTALHRGATSLSDPAMAQVSATPACDGNSVYVAGSVDGSLWVTAVNLDGRIAWQREAGPYHSRRGYQSSPVLFRSLVIVAGDNKGTRINRLVGSSYLAGLHRQTGDVIWRVLRPEADSFGTPVVAHIAGRDQLLMAGKDHVCSYDPSSGEMLWTCRWSGDRVANSVAFDDQHVYASTRHPRPELLCIRADGTGDVTRSHVVWNGNKSASEHPSPVVHAGLLYSVTDDGVLACLDAATGDTVWKRRLGGTVSASPLIAGQHLYCANEEGTVFVIRLGGRGELVATIPMGEGIFAAPIVSQNRLFLRTLVNLHCFENHEEAPMAVQPESPQRRL